VWETVEISNLREMLRRFYFVKSERRLSRKLREFYNIDPHVIKFSH
jgi:hypothetical protein